MSHIVFEKIRYKNFLSTGDSFIEIDLNRTNNTLVIGSNGSGKSTMLDAIAFALFGKAHRNIKKPLLVNSINKKRLAVELEFKTGNSKYVVSRGIKPNFFKILKDGELLNQTSATKDYQKILETNIIKMNYKSFHQIVVLGSSSFIPFMELPAQHRRSVIEDLLDIQIFSKMSILVKQKIQLNKETYKELENGIALAENNVKLKEKHFKEIDNMGDIWLKSKEDEISVIDKKISDSYDNLETFDETLTELNIAEINALKENKKSAEKQKIESTLTMKALEAKAQVFIRDGKCNTCLQDIDDTHKKIQLHYIKNNGFDTNDIRVRAIAELKEINKNMDLLLIVIDQFDEIIKSNKLINRDIERYKNNRKTLTNEIKTLKSNNTNKADKLKEEIGKYHDVLLKLNKRRSDVLEEGLYLTSIAEMLKDTGIKTKVIKQYLPVINKTINKYLSTLDFFVQFNLDENFNETIKSRHRDEFVYSSFSEGEKARIDLALLFTWRNISRIRNSSSTNLLILDETFDSSLDVDGLDNLMRILGTLPDGTNTFVITHKTDELADKFKSTIEFTKVKNFSVKV